MKRAVFLILLQLICIYIYSQPRVYLNSYKYFVGTTNPDAGWNQLTYDDASWLDGINGIGYGDIICNPYYEKPSNFSIEGVSLYEKGDTLIHTPISSSTSVYLRYPFIVPNTDTSGISGLSLYAYFDDGFIAYLNGVEFARVNMGKKGDTAYYNTLADRSHEAQHAAGDIYPVNGYFINRNFLNKHLKIGENIIAVEVHNDSIDGSDLLFKSKLRKCYYNDYCTLLCFDDVNDNSVNSYVLRTKACVELNSSDLPIIIVETNEYGIPFRHIEVTANMKIIDKPNGQINYFNDTSFTYNGQIRIEVRGNSSSFFPKQSFNIETQNSDSSNNNVSLLGMPAENDWKLIGPISDRSLIRHTFTYELGRKQGHWEPRSRFCELVINGEYLGLYALTEKIKPDKNRLNISKLKDTDLTSEDVTGGYIFWKSEDTPVQNYFPSDNKILNEQEAYLESFIQRFWDVIYKDNWLDQEVDYKDYVNIESMLDYMIINELTFDIDKYYGSTYMYKDRRDKDSLIHFGPLWDYNYAYGNTDYGSPTDQWLFNKGDGNKMFQKLLEDTSLTQRFAEKWHEQRNQFLHTDSLFALIDSLTNHIENARKRDSMVWEAYATVNIYFANDTVYQYDKIIANLKNWIERRVNWIDANIDDIYFPYNDEEPVNLISETQNKNLKVYPNPFYNQLNIKLSSTQAGLIQVDLCNSLGQIIQHWDINGSQQGNQKLTVTLQNDISPGYYILSIKQKGVSVGNLRVIKVE